MNESRPPFNPGELIKRFWWVVPLGLPLSVLLVFGLRDFVRDVLALPLSYTLWLFELIFRSIPQVWCWAGLLVAALMIALRSLERKRRPPVAAPPQVPRVPPGHIAIWEERITMLMEGKYSRHRFGYFIGKLILDVLSLEEDLGIRDVERRLEGGELELPPTVQQYLFARLKPGLGRTRSNLWMRLKQWLGLEKPLPAQVNAELESVIKFLEDQIGGLGS